jgi:hypothetical protein
VQRTCLLLTQSGIGSSITVLIQVKSGQFRTSKFVERPSKGGAPDSGTFPLKKVVSMTRNQSITVTTIFGVALAFVRATSASPASDACAALADSRNALYSMLSAKDKSSQDALKTKLEAASTKLDFVLAAMTGADANVATDFKVVWDQFKATRDKEIIPAIYKGNADDAKKIADGIQYQRFSKMWRIMSCK